MGAEYTNYVHDWWWDLPLAVRGWWAACRYGFPSRKLVVIGVTGTNGKTTVAHMIEKVLHAKEDCKVACISSSGFISGITGETLPAGTPMSAYRLHREIRHMVKRGVTHLVLESTSQGMATFRYIGISYDMFVLTNIKPTQLDVHNTFEEYLEEKRRLFELAARRRTKRLAGHIVPRIAVVNGKSEHSQHMLDPRIDQVFWYGAGYEGSAEATSVVGDNLSLDTWSVSFDVRVNGEVGVSGEHTAPETAHCTVGMPGKVTVENALAALTVGNALGIPLGSAAKQLEGFQLRGHFERIDEGQPFTVVVDYAPQPAGLSALYAALQNVKRRSTIHVLGSYSAIYGAETERKVRGIIVGEHADRIILTEDQSSGEEKEIAEQIAVGIHETKCRDNYVFIPDREAAITAAINGAQEGDLVLLTGIGHENILCRADADVPWNETEIARRIIRERLKNERVGVRLLKQASEKKRRNDRPEHQARV